MSVGAGLSWAHRALEEGRECWVGEEPVSGAAPSSGPEVLGQVAGGRQV